MIYSLKALFLLLVANGAPIIINNLLGKRWSWPVDFGIRLPDGRHLFGYSKTWRGVFAAIFATSIAAYMIDIDFKTGFAFGLLTMLGDLIASCCKRRLGIKESGRARGFDTGPETLLPLLWAQDQFHLTGIQIIAVVVIFFLMEEYLSPILYQLHIRKRPY